MRIAVGADHAGHDLKEHLREVLGGLGHQVEDLGTHSADSCDYPDFAVAVARAVAGGQADRGLLVCGTGVGMAMAANKVGGVRAANCHEIFVARLARAHNDANVLTLGARVIAPAHAEAILRAFLETAFDGGRHQGRVAKLDAIR